MKLHMLIVAAALASAPAAAATYLPVGPQNDVAIATVTSGGWTQCFIGNYGTGGASIAGILSACGGTRLMMAGRVTGSNTLQLLAQALREDVTFETGTGGNSTHNANGTDWYFNDSYSWGFAPEGVGVFRTSCDASGVFDSNTAGGAQRLCWHTGSGTLNGGWRLGNDTSLNSASNFERLMFTNTGGAIPEPASWAMLMAGFGLVGAAMRRRKAALAA
ncbi:PEPxxWA-CTERM sorting domain-containing protein [Sandarakinorhabdus sp.]|uniref:PEPxxWA-CTERM sorting domain-containing protein n=1 Tax=Sandarakinorhabdus sp. TaxID=1916663 RepID=UPI00286DB8B1|nr:PEPxxWA-CTERM sorting domain-containing protein [Sandarakinorhabdus sp.]